MLQTEVAEKNETYLMPKKLKFCLMVFKISKQKRLHSARTVTLWVHFVKLYCT